jgi:hypothetical protein
VTVTDRATADDFALWNEELQHGNLFQRAAAADKLATAKTALDNEFIFTACDELWRPIGECSGALIEANGNDPRNKAAAATIKIKGGHPLVPTLMETSKTLRGWTVETGGLRMAYYVDIHEYDWEKDAYTSTSNCMGIWDVLNYMQIWPMWFMPIQAQIFSHAVFIGGMVTVCENMIAEAALRIQSGINQFINQAGSLNPDMRNWFADLLLNNPLSFERLKTPMYVVRSNPFLDTSPLFAKTVRMQSCGKVITEITRPYGVDVSVTLWRPGDAQPDQWANLTQPTYVVTVKDRSQITGPTKTVLDAALRTVIDLQGSALGNVLDPLLNPQGLYAPQGVFIAPTLGVNFVQPYAQLFAPEPGEKSNLLTCKIADHTPKAWRITIGGKSPKWLVCAPPGDWGGADQPNTIQRSDQRVLPVDHRLSDDPDRNHRRTKHFAGRIPQRRVLGVPADRPLRTPPRHGPVPPGDGGIRRNRQQPIQHRGPIHLH